MIPAAIKAYVPVAAPAEAAPALIEFATDLPWGLWHPTAWGCLVRVGIWESSPHGWIWKPSEYRTIWIAGTLCRGVVVLKTEGAPRDRAGSPSKRFIVKPCVRHRPIEVLSSQSLTAVLVVVGYPSFSLIVSLSPNYRGLIRQELPCLVGEFRA